MWFLLLSGLWVLFADAFDAYESRIVTQWPANISTAIRAGLLAVVVYTFIPYFTPPLPGSRLFTVSLPVLVLVALLAERLIYARVMSRLAFRQRVLIIGAGRSGRTLAEALLDHGGNRYDIVGYVAENTAESSPRSAVDVRTGFRGHRIFPVVGDWQAVDELVIRHNVTTVVLSATEEVDSKLLGSLIESVESGVEVITMPVLYEQLTGRVPVEHVGRHWYVALPIHHPGTSAMRRFMKRTLDIVLACGGLACFGLMLPFIALATLLDSGRPIFYLQDRVGKGGRTFRVYKLRSMVRDAENGTARWAEARDARVTRVGRFLRATHVDEFPQFLNVLKGEMSAVGPRPERPEFIEDLAAKIPFYRLRHAVKPGMAGWGLVRQGYAGSEQDVLLRLQYDLYYIKHQSIWLDLLIVLKTIGHAATFRGR